MLDRKENCYLRQKLHQLSNRDRSVLHVPTSGVTIRPPLIRSNKWRWQHEQWIETRRWFTAHLTNFSSTVPPRGQSINLSFFRQFGLKLARYLRSVNAKLLADEAPSYPRRSPKIRRSVNSVNVEGIVSDVWAFIRLQDL